MPYLSTSEVMIHKDALYQVYVPLPLLSMIDSHHYVLRQGNAGLGLSMLILVLTAGVALVAVLSAIGVCERCNMESGGVYFLIGHVLGARTSAAIGIVYCFGQVRVVNSTF